MYETVHLDFDGTLTDTEQEAQPVIEHWEKMFSERADVPVGLIRGLIGDIKTRIVSDPLTGWTVGGCVMAPAWADPYVLNTTAYQHLVPLLADSGGCSLPKEQKLIDQMFLEIFRESYKFAGTAFRPGAKEFLDSLVARFHVKIVTNSQIGPVIAKLAKLGDYRIEIIGDTKKYVPDLSMNELPESVRHEGFPRPVILRRANYKKILDAFDPERTAVVGDIYELDLALPEYLGFGVVQLATPSTPQYEIDHHRNRPRNSFARTYDDALEFLSR